MQITHEQARTLIQLNADQALKSHESYALSLHLQSCAECHLYATELSEVENILRPLLKRQWNLQPAPLLAHVIAQRKQIKTSTRTLLATRTALVSAVFLMLVFSLWQFRLSGSPILNPLSVGIPPVPTPATQSTSTRLAYETCTSILYRVKQNDTLSEIAERYSVSEADIIAANNLGTQVIHASMDLVIPVCSPTPTLTLNPAAHTTTYTPLIELTDSTPPGY